MVGQPCLAFPPLPLPHIPCTSSCIASPRGACIASLDSEQCSCTDPTRPSPASRVDSSAPRHQAPRPALESSPVTSPPSLHPSPPHTHPTQQHTNLVVLLLITHTPPGRLTPLQPISTARPTAGVLAGPTGSCTHAGPRDAEQEELGLAPRPRRKSGASNPKVSVGGGGEA